MPEVLNGSLFKIVDFQSTAGRTVLDRYYYWIDVAPNTLTAVEVASVWEAKFNTVLPPIQPLSVQHVNIEVTEETSLSNFLSRASTISDGTLTGEGLTSWTAAKIRLFRTTKETRSGWKRPPAGNEAVAVGNKWIASFVTTLQAYADACADNIITSVGTLRPVIVRIIIDPVTGKPKIASFWVYNLVSDALALDDITTQNSRKK